MKQLFLITLVVLVAASFYTMATVPDATSDRPIVRWKTDPNPARFRQVDRFHEWQVRTGRVDARGEAAVKLVLETADNQSSLIQAVSGVGGDIIDARVDQFAAMGVAHPLDEFAQGAAFHYSRTYPGAYRLLTDPAGTQYAYPCNLTAAAYLVNRDVFTAVGMPPPPREWTPDEFERIGKEYIARANAGNPRPRRFLVGSTMDGEHGAILANLMARSQGVDLYNETLTAARCDDPRYVEAVVRLHNWTFRDRIFPTGADTASVNAEAGYGSFGGFGQLQSGQYAMIYTGRYALIRFREFAEKRQLASVQPPMFGFKNLHLAARTAVMYTGARDPETARLFFDYLADREYNETIIDGADGLPPNPDFARDNPDFLDPPDHPNENDIHRNEFEWALTIAIPPPVSPYFKATGSDWVSDALSKFFNRLVTDPAEALAEARKRYDDGIHDAVEANPRLRAAFDLDVEHQREIEARLERGEKIPAAWVINPFYQAYYRAQNRLED